MDDLIDAAGEPENLSSDEKQLFPRTDNGEYGGNGEYGVRGRNGTTRNHRKMIFLSSRARSQVSAQSSERSVQSESSVNRGSHGMPETSIIWPGCGIFSAGRRAFHERS